jgi:hypothetical protein
MRCTVMSRVIKHINALRVDEIFTTRDLLPLGERGSIDVATSTLVHEGFMIRLARGVFVKYRPGMRSISIHEVAAVKAAAFGRRIIRHGADCAFDMGLIEKGNVSVTYATDGHSSRFRAMGRWIVFKSTSARKMQMADEVAGIAIRGLVHLRERFVYQSTVEDVKRRLDRFELFRVQQFAMYAPSWLTEMFFPYREPPPRMRNCNAAALRDFRTAMRC